MLITAILPCAGQGLRFAAPYPKELHCVASGETLLDRAMAPLVDLTAKGFIVRLVVVLDADRALLLKYLSRYAKRFRLLMVFQSNLQEGTAGAVRDSLPYCEGNVVLILPDQSFDWTRQDNPLEMVLNLLGASSFAVVATRCADMHQLQHDGALLLNYQCDPPIIIAAEDKPSNATTYNGVWAAVACRIQDAGRLSDVLEPGSQTSPLQGAPAVIVTGYKNISRPEDLSV